MTTPPQDITTADFATQVLQNSAPVIVDFWSPRSEPSKQFSLILERVVTNFPQVILVKMNIDDHPDVATQLQIQSLPAAVAFFGGKPIEATTGAGGETEISAFVNKIATLASGAESENPQLQAALDQADTLVEQGNHAQAADIFASILSQIPENEKAFLGLATAWLTMGEIEKVRELLDQASPELRNSSSFATIEKALELAEQAESLGDLGELEKTSANEPNNHQARFDYALGLNGAGKRSEAADQLLEIIRKDRAWNDDKARLQLLDFFQAWGQADSATAEARRKLSGILFS